MNPKDIFAFLFDTNTRNKKQNSILKQNKKQRIQQTLE